MAFTMKVAEVIAADKTGLLAKHPSWERVSLSDIASILNGAPFDSSLFSNDEGVPLVRIRDVLSGFTSTRYSGAYDEAYLVEQGDLLVGMDGDFNSAFWGVQRALLNQRVCKISANPKFYDRHFLGYLLPGYLAAINANTPSTTVKHLSSKTIGEIDLPLPPRAEQSRIVEKLEELLSGLDAGVGELKAAQRKLRQCRHSLLKAAVEGTLTAAWRSENQPAESGAQLLERILTGYRARWEADQLAKFEDQGKKPPKDWQNKYLAPKQPDTRDLSSLPESWVWAKIALTGEVKLGRQRAPRYHTGPNMVPYLRVANVFENRIDTSDVKEMHFSEEEMEAFALESKDILLNEGQSLELVGRPAMYRGELPRACFTNTLVRYRANDGVIPEYALAVFLHYLHSGRFRKIATITTNIAHLGVGRFAEIEFPLPSTEEQVEIVKTLTEQMDNLERQQNSISLALQQSIAQRQNILKAAFSGRLVPQDPNDEPARLLLARIRAERAEREAQPKPRQARRQRRNDAMALKLIEVLAEATDWLPAQEAFRRCGVADGAQTDEVETLYSELRELDKAGRLAVESVPDAQGRKLYDRLKLLVAG